MRTVFDSSMVAHVWAQQTQEYGKNGTGNIYFRRDTIYSYGEHFPIARIVPRPHGQRVVYFTTRTYSVTTSGHMSTVRSALRDGETVFHLPPQAWDNSKAALKEYAARIAAETLAASRARSNQEWKIETAHATVSEANAYAKAHGLKTRFTHTFTAADLQAARERARIANAEKAAARERRDAEQIARDAERLARWMAGEGEGWTNFLGPVRLRIKGEEIQTSKGVRVPVTHAARVWRLVRACVTTGREYRRNGHTEHVGEFAIDHVAADGTLTAGCHTIAYAELARIAGLLGLDGGADAGPIDAPTSPVDPSPETVSDSGDGDTSCFEKPEGVPALAWHEYNRKFNDLLRGGKS